ncbi:recombination regulator RecX [Rhizobium sp. CNPSo 3464]|uniref:recombination regulator RecX n=1 Tax=Rhizobium sp. CNPSo 3464 TaxID=3021406 RepID=UPI002550D517|nr:recombination regulator RecX [Rhizobium sp. CNPSo 3464]MDK4739948.1 recombination regulator RecX [Rhizobium sp. CNPSo 3464]
MDQTPTTRMLAWARNSTIYRLERKMMTEKQLFDVITRKAKQKFEDISDAQIKAVADFAVQFAYDQNALNDVAYAEISTRSAMRSGKSRKAIGYKLASKGIDSNTVMTALDATNDLFAAIIFARKRGFGPFRRDEPDEKRKAKELSAFARNGFGFEIGKAIFHMSRQEAEELLQSSPVV